jgi:hypothetical protein
VEHSDAPKNSYALRFKQKQRVKRHKSALYLIQPSPPKKKKVEKAVEKASARSRVSPSNAKIKSNHVSPANSSKHISPVKKTELKKPELKKHRSLFPNAPAKEPIPPTTRSLIEKEKDFKEKDFLPGEVIYVENTAREIQFDDVKLQDVSSAKTCLDFLVITLCNTMHVKSKDAVLLLTVNSKELSKWIVDGKNKEYKEVISWFKEMHSKVGFQRVVINQKR